MLKALKPLLFNTDNVRCAFGNLVVEGGALYVRLGAVIVGKRVVMFRGSD